MFSLLTGYYLDDSHLLFLSFVFLVMTLCNLVSETSITTYKTTRAHKPEDRS